MSAGAIGSSTLTNATNNTSQTNNNNAFGELDSIEFIEILVSELTNQDPFEPNDSAQILEQLSSLRSIESQTALQDSLESLVDQNSIASASGYIGQFVEGLNNANNEVSGLVVGLSIEAGQPVLQLDDGTSLAANRVTEISPLPDSNELATQQMLANLITVNSAALVGQKVTGLDDGGNQVTGLVTEVRRDDSDLYLELDSGHTVRAGRVTSFTDPDGNLVAGSPATTTSTTTTVTGDTDDESANESANEATDNPAA